MLATFAMSGGAWIFMAIVASWSTLTMIGLYTRRGSGINQRPWRNPALGQTGADGSSVLDHDRVAAQNLTRGTR